MGIWNFTIILLSVGELEENREGYENAFGEFVENLSTTCPECVKVQGKSGKFQNSKNELQ